MSLRQDRATGFVLIMPLRLENMPLRHGLNPSKPWPESDTYTGPTWIVEAALKNRQLSRKRRHGVST
jgi:hypothetical protein